MRYRIIAALDWIDDNVLRHRLHRVGLCTWLVLHPWWDTKESV